MEEGNGERRKAKEDQHRIVRLQVGVGVVHVRPQRQVGRARRRQKYLGEGDGQTSVSAAAREEPEERSLCSGTNAIKLFTSVFTNVRNELECSFSA
jgi:hypothetical protein